ncbi:MAG TPA: YihY/virulence factor BrkB family protein [Solirubrobacteraceae bacterium]|nr:YihY/virulence factor BrkB family protein [Solirubrobacteraceae bacterium]
MAPDHGGMTSPAALPRASWADTLKRTVREFRDDKLQHWAAALTYYAVLSIFPALLVMVSLLGLFGDPERITKVLTDTVSQLGPASAASTFQGPIQSITDNRGGAGLMLIVSVAGALWAASGYVSAFTDAANTIYEVEEGRPFWKLKPIQLLLTLVLILMAATVALALVLSGPIVGALGGALGLSDTALSVWRIAKWPAMVLLVLVIFGVLYYATPNARVSGLRWVSGGAVVALVVWIVASVAFAFYASNFSSYDKTYGALGGVVVFLLWLWITNLAILLGAEFNAETERARALHHGAPGAEDVIGLEHREAPNGAKQPAAR